MVALTDLTLLAAQLLTISAVTKILIDVFSSPINKLPQTANVKLALSYLIPIVLVFILNISVFETEKEFVFYFGSIVAGGLAGLGSTYIHETLKALQTLKDLKK